MKINIIIISCVVFLNIFSSCASEIDGVYEIKAAYSMIHDQEVKEITTKKTGELLRINFNKMVFENIKYSVSKLKKGSGWYRSDGRLNYSDFCLSFIGMNYPPFPVNIIDPDITESDIEWDAEKEFPGNVIVRSADSKEYSYTLFFANNKLIIAGYEDEFEHLKDWPIDNFFYVAELVK
jgi:hypothetical protein